MAFAGRTKLNTSLVFKSVKHTRGMRYSPGISTSAVAREKLLKNLHFSSSRKDLIKNINDMITALNEQHI